MHGLYICPDIDTVIYGLSGLLDRGRGWGIHGDTFHALEQMKELGLASWFKIGDKDIALHVARSNLLMGGISLSQATEEISNKFGIEATIIPASNQQLETWIDTPEGEIHLQEYWVKNKASNNVLSVKYKGAEKALPSPKIVDSIMQAEKVIICPGNPVTSIGPILAISEIREALCKTSSRIISISPIIGEKPLSGPAALLMAAMGIPISPMGVVNMYSDFLDNIVVHDADLDIQSEIMKKGVEVESTNIIMLSDQDEDRLGKFVLEA